MGTRKSENVKKSIFFRWWFWLIVVVVVSIGFEGILSATGAPIKSDTSAKSSSVVKKSNATEKKTTDLTKIQQMMQNNPKFEAVVTAYYALPLKQQTQAWTKYIEGKVVTVSGTVMYAGSSSTWVIPTSRYHGQTSQDIKDEDLIWVIAVKNTEGATVGHEISGKVKLTSRGANMKRMKANWDGYVQ